MSGLSHLDELEAEAIYIIREVAAECEKPVMLYSIGKDSSVMLHLALKAFYPEKPPFPFLHVNTTWKFKEMIEFRDKTAKALGIEMMQYINHPKGEELVVSTKDSIHSLIDKVTAIEIDTLKETRNMLNPEDFLKALNLFIKSKHIDFYAMDNNLDIARIASAGFIMGNKCSGGHSPMTMQYLQATSASKDHLGFIISRTGNNRMLLDIARLLKLRGISFILITASPKSEIAS